MYILDSGFKIQVSRFNGCKIKGSRCSGADGTDQGVKHFGDFFCLDQPAFTLFPFYVANVHSYVDLCSEFACRAFCVIQEIGDFLVHDDV